MINQLFNLSHPQEWKRPLRWILSGFLLSAVSTFALPPIFIPSIADQSISEDTTNSFDFVVLSTNTPLTYTFESTDTLLLTTNAMGVTGLGPSYTFTAIPEADANGTSVVSIIATDTLSQSSTNTFEIGVTPVNDAPTATTVTNFYQMPEDTVTNILVNVADIDSMVGSLNLVDINSTNTALIANGATWSAPTPTTRLINLAPLTNAFGFTEISFAVTDGGATSSVVTFSVEVTPVNDPPFISTAIGNQTTDEDVNLSGLIFRIGDVDNAPGELSISTNSSNTSLLLNSGIVLNNASGGTNWTVNLNLQPDKNGTSVVSLVVSDLESLEVTNVFSVVVDPIPDTSTVSGVVSAAFGDDVGATNAFSTVVIGDVDYANPAFSNLNLTVSLGSDRWATFPGGLTNFTASGSPSQVSAAITNLVVIPERLTGIPDTLHTEAVTIRVVGSDDGLVISTNLNLDITVINSPPEFQIDLSPAQIIEGQSLQLFDLIFVSDPNVGDNAFSLSVDFDNGGQSGYGNFVPTNRVEGNATTLAAAIENINFQAALGVVTGVSDSVDLKFTLVDGYGGSNIVTNTVSILRTQTPPNISGIPVQTFLKSDGSPAFNPLPTVFVSDDDEGGGQSVRATLELSNTNIGSLSATSFNLQSSAQLTAALRAVEYTPIPGVLPINSSADTVLTLTVIDALNLETPNNNVTIEITSVNNAPQILNIPTEVEQPDLILPALPLLPFKDLGLVNDDTNDVLFTISMDDVAKGSLTNLGSFVNTGSGVYEANGSIGTILNSLTNLQYVLSPTFLFPIDDPGGTVFTLSARDFSLLTKTETLAIQVQDEPKNFLVTRTFNDGQPGSFAYALDNAGNNDFITFALPSYPAQIAMLSNLSTRILDRNLTIKGPGAPLLTLSGDTDGNMTPDRQLFSIRAKVTIEGVTLSDGSASFGGLFRFNPTDFLRFEIVLLWIALPTSMELGLMWMAES